MKKIVTLVMIMLLAVTFVFSAAACSIDTGTGGPDKPDVKPEENPDAEVI